MPRLSLLLCLLLFSRSESLAWPGTSALRSARPKAESERGQVTGAAANLRSRTELRASTSAEPAPSEPLVRDREPLVRGVEPPARFGSAGNRTTGRAPTNARALATPAAGEPTKLAASARAVESSPARVPARLDPALGSPTSSATAAPEQAHAATSATSPKTTDLHPPGEPPRASAASPARISSTAPALDEYSDRHESASSLLPQALTAFVSGRLNEAKLLYQQALRLEPNNPAALRGVGLAAARLGDKALARDSLRRYLAVSPSAPDRAAIEARLASLTK
jgi:Flp pilus assembly protein TadD